ncbi:MAG TPA: mechanosensitive ion channel domain-containing protein [Sphingomicrobium sp.]|nr:mechanosensitive ion channel domain-containing protein [Sphingomicrobium sp.]
MIGGLHAAKTVAMGADALSSWLEANRDGLVAGLLAGLALVAVMLVLRSYGRSVVARDPLGVGWRSLIGRILAKTNVFFMIFTAAAVVATYAELPARAARLIDIGFVIAFAIQGALWGRELVLGVIGRKVAEENGAGALSNAMALIRVLISVALFAIAGILILDNLGVNVTALIAGLGIGGIAIGLAAQGIFSDLFAALAILFDRPFKKGDTIRYGTSVGTVERIGLKTTRLRSLSGEQLVMANTKLLEQEIHNLAEGNSRRMTLPFGLIYQTPPEQLERLPEIASQAVGTQRGCRFVRCAMVGFGASSLDHELVYDNMTLDPERMAANRTAIMIALIRAFAEEGIQFAFPIELSFTAAPDGTLIMPYPEPSRDEG